jgi:hypothetical protein
MNELVDVLAAAEDGAALKETGRALADVVVAADATVRSGGVPVIGANANPVAVPVRLEFIIFEIERLQPDAALAIAAKLAEARDIFRYRRDEGGFGEYVERQLTFLRGKSLSAPKLASRFRRGRRRKCPGYGYSAATGRRLAGRTTDSEARCGWRAAFGSRDQARNREGGRRSAETPTRQALRLRKSARPHAERSNAGAAAMNLGVIGRFPAWFGCSTIPLPMEAECG